MKLKELLNNETFLSKYGDYEIVGDSYTTVRGNDKSKLVFDIQKPKPKTAWDLKEGDDCYYIDLFGDIEDTGGYLRPLSEAIEMGNVFLTRKEAEKDIERRKVETLLLKYGGRRWFKQGGENWVLYLDKHNQATRCIAERPHQGMIYFDRHGDAVKACEEIGNKRIVNALFGVR